MMTRYGLLPKAQLAFRFLKAPSSRDNVPYKKWTCVISTAAKAVPDAVPVRVFWLTEVSHYIITKIIAAIVICIITI